jgi:hypothetical protein
MVSPMFKESRCWLILPPSGNFGWTPALYTFMTNITFPSVSSPDVGVYDLEIKNEYTQSA